jgi:hypothetical protein
LAEEASRIGSLYGRIGFALKLHKNEKPSPDYQNRLIKNPVHA